VEWVERIAGALVVCIAGVVVAVLAAGGDEPRPAARLARAASAQAPAPGPGAAQATTTASPSTTETSTPEATTSPATDPTPVVPLRQLVGERLFVRMNGTSPSRAFRARVRRGEVGGVVLFGPNVSTRAQVRRLVARLDAAARAGGVPAPLVAIDQEGGIVKRLQTAPPTRSAPQIGATNSTRVARGEGRATARSLRALGIDIDYAPVVDVPASSSSFIAPRAFGRDPKRVARLGGAFADGLQRGGVAATLKHFPGLGSAPANTDFASAVVSAPRSRLRRELVPYRRTEARLVMLATAVYPAYHRGVPAAFSRRVVTGLLREDLHYQGVVVTDDLETPAVRAYTSPSEGAVRAIEAGADMALVVGTEAGGEAAFDRMLAAARSERLTRERLEASHARVESLRRAAATP
jgi:beta-N-acetylhexosaminidase